LFTILFELHKGQGAFLQRSFFAYLADRT